MDDGTVSQVAATLLDFRYETWSFGDSIAFEALLAAGSALDDSRYHAFARGWIRSWVSRAEPFRPLDCTAPGLAMVQLARADGDETTLRTLGRLADYLLARPRLGDVFRTWERSPLRAPYGGAPLDDVEAALLADPPPGVFVDCLHFDPPFLVSLGAATGRRDYVAEGVRQAIGYLDLLQRPDGLFDHFVLVGVEGRFGPGWGRGQGWALLGLTDVIAAARPMELPDSTRQEIGRLEHAVELLAGSMMARQRGDGHWDAVVDDPASGLETSTAAFFAVGLRRLAALGLTTAGGPGAVVAAAERAWAAVRSAIDDDGTLRQVSAAVWACTEPSHYAHVPRDLLVPWGQGPAVLALLEA